MSKSTTYRIFVISFLLLFSFFHVGFAAVEYICSMGMKMEAPVCSSCHAGHDHPGGKVTITSTGKTTCCNVVVTKTETIDTYVINQVKAQSFIEHALASDIVALTTDEKPSANYFNHTTPVLPIFNLHGISTSIQYTSFLR